MDRVIHNGNPTKIRLLTLAIILKALSWRRTGSQSAISRRSKINTIRHDNFIVHSCFDLINNLLHQCTNTPRQIKSNDVDVVVVHYCIPIEGISKFKKFVETCAEGHIFFRRIKRFFEAIAISSHNDRFVQELDSEETAWELFSGHRIRKVPFCILLKWILQCGK